MGKKKVMLVIASKVKAYAKDSEDRSSPRVICEWIKENIETCGSAKLFEALSRAIRMRDAIGRKAAD